eukprot:COSAG02_NODE_41948_length_389_cov_0.875862_1_plen_31_part_10
MQELDSSQNKDVVVGYEVYRSGAKPSKLKNG